MINRTFGGRRESGKTGGGKAGNSTRNPVTEAGSRLVAAYVPVCEVAKDTANSEQPERAHASGNGLSRNMEKQNPTFPLQSNAHIVLLTC